MGLIYCDCMSVLDRLKCTGLQRPCNILGGPRINTGVDSNQGMTPVLNISIVVVSLSILG